MKKYFEYRLISKEYFFLPNEIYLTEIDVALPYSLIRTGFSVVYCKSKPIYTGFVVTLKQRYHFY